MRIKSKEKLFIDNAYIGVCLYIYILEEKTTNNYDKYKFKYYFG